jgi:Xaa-Pro aminopeptidase
MITNKKNLLRTIIHSISMSSLKTSGRSYGKVHGQVSTVLSKCSTPMRSVRTLVRNCVVANIWTKAGDIKFIRKYLDDIIARAGSIYMDIAPGNSEIASFFHPHVRRGTMEVNIHELIKHHKKETTLCPLTRIVQSLRAVKSEAELKVMQKAGKISGRAITRAYGRRFTKEADLNAYLDYAFRIGGCEKSAYVPVVAGGKVHSITVN